MQFIQLHILSFKYNASKRVTLFVFAGGVERGGRSVKRLDYWLWHQDIVTAAPTIDIKVFRIPDEGLFIALASFNSSEVSKQQSTIFKWHHDHFRLHQSIYTLAARGWETFHIGHDVS